MTRIIEVGGIDYCRKTTQIKRVTAILEGKEFSCKIAPKRIELSSRFPKNYGDRVVWYQNAPAEETPSAIK